MTEENTPSPKEFENTLKQLETLVERMEQGESSLQDSLKDFEQGIHLARECRTALEQAEQQVEILLNTEGEPEPLQNS